MKQAPPDGAWNLVDGAGGAVEVLSVHAGERHALGRLDPDVLIEAVQSLAALAAEGDEEAIDRTYLLHTTNVGYNGRHHVARCAELETLCALSAPGDTKAIQLACASVNHQEAAVREAAIDVLLRVARPEDMQLVDRLLVHGKGQHAAAF